MIEALKKRPLIVLGLVIGIMIGTWRASDAPFWWLLIGLGIIAGLVFATRTAFRRKLRDKS